jgi:hypothetical protein
MAVHPIYPLLAVCDSDQTLCLYHINADQPPLMRLMRLINGLAYDCIAFHSTLPFVAAGCRETGQVNFWNIQKMLDHPDEELNFEEPELKSFATATMVNPSYIIFHPTRPYIAVGGVDRESASSFIKIFEVNVEPVEVNSIELPMDEDDPYDKIESITFSPDGVFLAATFGKHIMVWFYEEMKVLMDVDMHMDVKSLVFGPIDDIILVAGCETSRQSGRIYSFKIEKDIPNGSAATAAHATPDGWKMTPFTKTKQTSAISTLAFHPLTPMLVGGFVNGDVNSYYKFGESDADDPLTEIMKYHFKNPIPFNGPHFPMPSVAFNRQFIVTCGSNRVYVYAIDKIFGVGFEKVLETSFPTKDMPRLFTKIMQFEEQKNIIMKSVRKVFEGFSIDESESGDYLRVQCEITDKRRKCLVLEFIEHNFYKEHHGDGGDMEFEPEHEGLVVLYIGSLIKCGANSGNSLLALIDELAKLIPFIEYIALEDASHLMKCDKAVDLFQLKSLASATGDSWYGSKGYKPQSHAEVMAYNMQLRNRNMAELLEVVDPSVETDIMEAFPELDQHMHGMTVHDCFKMMSDKIRSFPEEKCTVEQNKKIEALDGLMYAMNSSDFKLEQNYHLLKQVSHGGYKRVTKKRGGTKKRTTKKRRTKCSKNLPQRFL